MNNIIQSNFDYLINVKLFNEINDNNNKKKLIETKIQNILNENPNIISQSLINQIGGNIDTLGRKDLDKIKQLNELFKEYTSHIKNDTTTVDIDKIKNILKSLKEKVNESTTTLNHLILPQYLPQNLETVLTTISKNQIGEIGEDGKDSFFNQLNELYKIKIPSNNQDPDYKKYKNLLEILQKTINDFQNAQVKRVKYDNEQQKDILSNIEKQKKDIDKYIIDIEKSILFYKETNKNIENSFKKNTSISSTSFFDPNDPNETDINETERIYNQLININPEKPSKSSSLLNVLNENISNLLQDLQVDGQEFTINSKDVSKIYDAQFVMNEDGKISIESKYNKIDKKLTGGNIDKIDIIDNIDKIENEIMDFTQKVTKFKRKFDDYKIELSKYNFLQIKQIYHTIYSLMVLTNSIYNVSNYTIFKNVGRGTINFYLRIINNIFDDLENPKKFKDPLIAEIRKKHYVTVIKLKYFLEDLNKKFTSSSKKLRISSTNPYIKNMFTLLSHFRRFLEDYSIQGLSKVSIYARINYIKGKNTDLDNIVNPFENYESYAMFFSDTERLTTNEGYNFHKLLDIDKTNLLINNNDDETIKLKKIQDILNNKKFLTDRDDRLMWVRRDTCNAIEDKDKIKLPPLRAINFTEVFDSTQYAHNEDISRYMNLASRLSTGSGICLITYGYSGTGKTYTLFGKVDEGKEIKGLLQSTLSQLNGLVGVHFRLFELYGYGFSHPDYWKNVDKTPRINNISHKVFEYKLKNLGSEGLDIDKIEEYSSDEIKNFIDHIQKVRGHDLNNEFENFYDIHTEKGHDADYNFTKNNTDLKIATPNSLKFETFSKIPQKLNYAFIDGKNIEEVFGKFSKFTNEVDKARKTGKGCDTTKQEDLIKRIRDTPNNIESSRSVLVYDFILGIKEDGKIKLVSFLIIDLPGREEIGKTFVSPFETDAIQNAIKFGYNEKLKKENNNISSINIDIEKIKDAAINAIGTNQNQQSKKWLEKLNYDPLQNKKIKFSNFSKIINNLRIVEIYDNIKEIYGSKNTISSISKSIYDFDIPNANTIDSYIYDLIQTECNPDTYIQEIRMLLLCMTLNPLCVPLFAHNIIKQFINNNKAEITKIHNTDIEMSFIINNSPIKGLFKIGDEYINSTGKKLNYFFSTDENGSNPDFFSDPPQEKRGIGYSSVFKNRQIKIVYYIHLMNRLILLNRTDLIKKLYEMIIDHKINKLIKLQIDNFTDSKSIEYFITDLIKNNFKGQFLKEKLIEKEICSFTQNNEAILLTSYKSNISQELKNLIFNIVKYDYFINGFEGLYINENIMGLIKYLSDKRLTGNSNQNIDEQGEKLNFQNQQRIARLMLISKDVMPPQDDKEKSSQKYDKLIINLLKLRKKYLSFLKQKKDELDNFTEIQKLNDEEKNLNDIYKSLKQNLEKDYNKFIINTKNNFKTNFNQLVNNIDDFDNYYSSNIKNIYNEDKLNTIKFELKQKSINFINKVNDKLNLQLKDYYKFDKEKDYAIAVADLYQKLYSEFTKNTNITFSNNNIAYYLIDYYKYINDTDKINIAQIIKNSIEDIGYNTTTNFSNKIVGNFKNIYNINDSNNICDIDGNTSKICNVDNWTKTELYNKYKINFNTLSNYSIGELFVYLQNYLSNYFKGTFNFLQQIKFDNDNFQKIINNISVLNIQLSTNIEKWDMASTIKTQNLNKPFSLDDFKTYANNIHTLRIKPVQFLKILQNEIELSLNDNILNDFKLCNINLLDTYPEVLNLNIPSQITFNKTSLELNDTDNIITYKYKQVIKFVNDIQNEIKSKYDNDKVKEINLLDSVIKELEIICMQMSNVIGLNNNYKADNNNISIRPIIPIGNNLYKTYNFDDNFENDFEKDILDVTININNLNELKIQIDTILNNYITQNDIYYPLKDINIRYTKENLNDNNKLIFDYSTDIESNKFSLMDQIYLLKHLETNEQREKLNKALTGNAQKYKEDAARLFNISLEEYEAFERNCGHLFKAGMRYKNINSSNNESSLVKAYEYINNTYSSSKIFCKEFPIIQNILESYLPPQPVKPSSTDKLLIPDLDAPLDFSKSYITDFKVFYLFANYDKKNEGLSKLKCKNQYDLLENTLGFIEAIYK